MALAVIEAVTEAKGTKRKPRAGAANEPAKPVVGAPRIHDELLRLSFEDRQASVSRYLPRQLPNQDETWKAFLRSHLYGTATVDFVLKPRLLFGLVVLSHSWHRLVHIAVTTNRTAACTALQITEAIP